MTTNLRKLIASTQTGLAKKVSKSHLGTAHPRLADILPKEAKSKTAYTQDLPNEIRQLFKDHSGQDHLGALTGVEFTYKSKTYYMAKHSFTPPSTPVTGRRRDSDDVCKSTDTQREYMLFAKTPKGKWQAIRHTIKSTPQGPKLAIPKKQESLIKKAKTEAVEHKPVDQPTTLVVPEQPQVADKAPDKASTSRIYRKEDLDQLRGSVSPFINGGWNVKSEILRKYIFNIVGTYCACLAQNKELVQDADLKTLYRLYTTIPKILPIIKAQQAESKMGISADHAAVVQLFCLTLTILGDNTSRLSPAQSEHVTKMDETMPDIFKRLKTDYRDPKAPIYWTAANMGMNMGVVMDIGYARDYYVEKEPKTSLFNINDPAFRAYKKVQDSYSLSTIVWPDQYGCGYAVGGNYMSVDSRIRLATASA